MTKLHCYVHVPFCRERCSYCDFFLVTRQDLLGRFFSALHSESSERLAALRGSTVHSVHFGGGTPSSVPVAYLKNWFETLSRHVSLSDDAEITLEANPEDLTNEKLQELAALGVNRLSIGVQSFIPEKLRALGRLHSAEEALRVTDDAMKLLGNVSVDLICGVEGEDPDIWERDLYTAISRGLPHVSVYMLTLEKKTRLENLVRRGLVTLPDESVQADMYMMACELLEAEGFKHYEVSNFSKPGFFSRYNLGCWQRESYLGFGPSAHSFLVSGDHELRSANVSSMIRYMTSPYEAQEYCEMLSCAERINEKIFLSLRLSSGLELVDLMRYHDGSSVVVENVDQLKKQGLIEIRDGVIKVSRKGFLFADRVAEELLPAWKRD
ncbi:radical SAM family heme chaperone HemW [Prosthecochloris sp.]|uniref:radical SAM family heme chaperone HemW n=1 Tax=Prosthecochloris sp. TaxID=290513 RepID=UPI0025F69188|nr:radical SAM family heme chaperone HemW [Prosthecochloris sp.]